MLEEKITFDKFIRWMLIALLVGAVLFITNYLSNVLLPFFVAWLLAYLLYPIVKFVQYKMHVPTRALSIIVALIFVIAVIGGDILSHSSADDRTVRQAGRCALALSAQDYAHKQLSQHHKAMD